MDWKAESPQTLADCKREAAKADRLKYDRLAVEIITQEIAPLKMADNLNYWMKLSESMAV